MYISNYMIINSYYIRSYYSDCKKYIANQCLIYNARCYLWNHLSFFHALPKNPIGIPDHLWRVSLQLGIIDLIVADRHTVVVRCWARRISQSVKIPKWTFDGLRCVQLSMVFKRGRDSITL